MTEQELLAAIEGLVPLLEARAAAAEQARKPDDEVMRAIEATGIYRYFVPRAYGGFEYGMETFMRIGMALGEGCVSTGWVVTFCTEHNWLMALYGKQAQDEIFGRQPYIIAPGTLSPNGTAVPADGGYRITGRWPWGTGVMHADWALVSALTPVVGAERPELWMFVVPMSVVRVIDTWHVAGMAATGSNDIAVDDVFVPAHLAQPLGRIRNGTADGTRVSDSHLYRMPMVGVLGLTAAAPAVGAARKVVRLFSERMQTRTVYGTTSKQAERSSAHQRLGMAALRARNAELLLLQIARDVEALGRRGEPCSEAEQAMLRLRIGDVVLQSRQVARDVVDASGASVHFLDNPLQRFLRDLQTLSCHTIFDTDISSEQVGRTLLGLPA